VEGFHVTVSPFFTPDFFRVVYRRGEYLKKAILFTLQALNRLRLINRAGDYDVIFVYREAFPLGPPLIEMALSRICGRALLYDFDDAIFLPNTSQANRMVTFLKYPAKVRTIIRESKHVVAGNRYLAQYARRYTHRVTVIPSCVDTTRFVPNTRSRKLDPERPLVGWIGSPTTVPYLLSLEDVLTRMAQDQPFTLRVSGAGRTLKFPGVVVDNVPWTLEQEVSLFNTCDVGVYPLWDDAWSRGKCGFKAIQFMACGVPVVAAAVGVNREIIEDGVNGFLASTETEWLEKLGWLLTDHALRKKLGQAARETVLDRYSLAVHAPMMAAVFRSVVQAA